MPASLIDNEDGVGTGRDDRGDLGEVQVHCLSIAGRQDQGRAFALLRADSAENVGRGGPPDAWGSFLKSSIAPAAHRTNFRR